MASEDEKNYIRSIEKAFAVIRAFDNDVNRALGNQELAKRTGMAKSTLSRLTYTLITLGYLNYSKSERKYYIGDAMIGLSASLLQSFDARFAIHKYLEEVALETEGTVGMSIFDGGEMVYLDHARSDKHPSFHRNLGTRIPLETSSQGMALLAVLEEDERAKILNGVRERSPDKWSKIEASVAENVDLFSKRGYAIALGLWYPDLNGVAVPVWSPRHATYIMFNCGGSAAVITKDKILSDIGPRLLALGDRVRPLLSEVNDNPVR